VGGTEIVQDILYRLCPITDCSTSQITPLVQSVLESLCGAACSPSEVTTQLDRAVTELHCTPAGCDLLRLVALLRTVSDNDCPEGDGFSLSAFCGARDQDRGAYALSSADDFDNLVPTYTYSPACHDADGPNNVVCQTDNRSLTAYIEGTIDQYGRAQIQDALLGSYDTTALNATFLLSPQYSGGSETDIIYQQNLNAVPSGYAGITWCNDAVTKHRCDQQYIAFLSTGPDRDIACHETGHAVGLTHGNDAYPRVYAHDEVLLGCMTNPAKSQYLGSYNTKHINSVYGE
jgi:hypothetical protein